MNPLHLIPIPRNIKELSGAPFDIHSAKTLGINHESLRALSTEFQHNLQNRGLSLQLEPEAGDQSIVLELESSLKSNGKGGESYELKIDSRQIRIRASHERGLFYGTRTLLQLLDRNESLSPMEISDWPDLPMRGVHFMLQGPIPKLDWFLHALDDLAQCKINTILLEYEDKFPYEKHPVIKHPQAFQPGQLRQILDAAKARHIQVIPLLQCFGHIEYILKHPEYEHLRERPHDPFQCCPSNEESFKLFTEMALEILPFHKDEKFFHVGADETYFLGACPVCRKKAGTFDEKADLYIGHLNRVCDFILSHGKTPILWSDMLVDFPSHLAELNRKAVIMYWDYTPSTPKVPWVKWKGRVFLGEDIEDDIPKCVSDILKPYWGGDPFPKSMNAFPYAKFFKDGGHEMIVAPIADQPQTLGNIAEFTAQARATSALGAMTTCWPLFPAGHAWPGFMATADQAWNGNATAASFGARLAARHFDRPDCQASLLPGLLNRRSRPPAVAEKLLLEAQAILQNLPQPLPQHAWIYQCFQTLAAQKHFEIERLAIMPRAAEMEASIKVIEWNDFMEVANPPATPGLQDAFSRENLLDTVENLKSLRRRMMEFRELMTARLGAFATPEAIAEFFQTICEKDLKQLDQCLPHLKLLLAAKNMEIHF
ncbi:MAG: glycoside hydrolase family 20 zincin-like fold domain-containing protein [Verrucomicrobiae bacterium]|nr:glycoside hydrolase family 20 zincin-like fold domain-containing protein [Verrucomicrobiae bacterium]